MFGSDILDISIGLVLVYLILSVLMTSVVEGIEAILKTRAGDLERAIGQLLGGETLEAFYKHPLIDGLFRGAYEPRKSAGGAAAGGDAASAGDGGQVLTVASQGDTKSQGQASAPVKSRVMTKLPSYIPREIFSAAVLDLANKEGGAELKGKINALAPGLLDSSVAVGNALKTLAAAVDPDAILKAQAAVNSAQAAFARERRSLEQWYDSAMDRASGIFKRRTQSRLFVVGLAIAVVVNVNSVVIAQYLATHPAAREEMFALARKAEASAPVPKRDAALIPAPNQGGAGSGNGAAANEAAAEAGGGNETAADRSVGGKSGTAPTAAVRKDNALKSTGGQEAANAERVNCYSASLAPASNAGSVGVDGNETAASDAVENEVESSEAIDNQVDGNVLTVGNGVESRSGTNLAVSEDPIYRACRDRWTSEYLAQLQDIGLPIGWEYTTYNRERAMVLMPNGGLSILGLVLLALGYLATAFAVMLGAPFWFDLLSKLMVVRSTVKPTQKSPDEPPAEGR